jgi:transposase-like protein
MNNYQNKAREEIIATVTIKCKDCKTPMIHVIDLYDESIVGFSCSNCPNYFLYGVTTDIV